MMRSPLDVPGRCGWSVPVVLLLAGALVAQQPNTAEASLALNGRTGPVVPIANVSVPIGVPGIVSVEGNPNLPFQIWASAGLVPNGSPTLFGLIDLQNSPLELVADGLNDFAFRTDATGHWSLFATLGPQTPLGHRLAMQALVANPGALAGATLSAATEMVATNPVQNILPASLPVQIDMAALGVNFPFFGTLYNEVWLNKDGSLTFGGPDNDPSSTPSELVAGLPRVAACWTELDPNFGQVTISGGRLPSTTPHAGLQITFSNVASGPQGAGPPLSFEVILENLTGLITITHLSGNAAPVEPMMMGICAGGSVLPNPMTVNATTDFSALNTTPLSYPAGQPIFEWFGDPSMTGFVGNRPYDFQGRTTHMLPLVIGGYLAW